MSITEHVNAWKVYCAINSYNRLLLLLWGYYES
jgi:hypothetical protein